MGFKRLLDKLKIDSPSAATPRTGRTDARTTMLNRAMT